MQDKNMESLLDKVDNISVDSQEKKSLLDSLTAENSASTGGFPETLLDDTSSPTITAPEYDPEKDASRRRAYFMNPEVQAEIVLDNYLRNKGYVVSGKEKRALRREFLRNAKKGKYRKLFQDLIEGAEKEEKEEKEKSKEAISLLN